MRCDMRILGPFFRIAAVVALWPQAWLLRAQVNITAQPQSVTVPAGASASLTVSATGPGVIDYQWRRSGYALPGATSARLTIPAASQGDSDRYDVVVRSLGGFSPPVVSDPARLWVTLPSYPGALQVDLARSLRLESFGRAGVNAAAVLPDGRYYLCGDYTSVGGLPTGKVVRCNPDGSLDASFSPPAFDRAPSSLAVQQDGKILVAGAFKTVGEEPIGSLVRLNADGSRDTSFAVGRGFSNQAERVLVTQGGAIYVTGRLGSYQGAGPYSTLAKLSPGGSIDASFTRPDITNGIGIGSASSYAVSPDGGLYIAGEFDRVNGAARRRIARLLPNGALDVTFDPLGGPNSIVWTILAASSGQLLAGGEFTSFNGTAVGRIVRLNRNGSIDPSFSAGEGFSRGVTRLAELSGNRILVQSINSTYKGAFVPYLVRLTPNGDLDGSFSYGPGVVMFPYIMTAFANGRVLVAGSSPTTDEQFLRIVEANGVASTVPPALGSPGKINAFAHVGGGRILAGGDFTRVAGQQASYLMRLNADGTRDPSFPRGAGAGSSVSHLVVQPDGKLVVVAADGIVRLDADGGRDPNFFTSAQIGAAVPARPAVLPGGRIFVPTVEPTWEGTLVQGGFVVLDATGRRVVLHEFLPGPPGRPRLSAVEKMSDGGLLVGGGFSTWNDLARPGLVRLAPTGAVDLGFVVASGLRPGPAGNLSGGPFQRDGGILTIDANALIAVRLRPNGERDDTYAGLVPGARNGFRSLMQPDGALIATGPGPASLNEDFPPPIFARLTATGSVDASFVVLGSQVWSAAILTDRGELLSSDDTGYVHAYRVVPPPTIVRPPQSQVIGSGSLLSLTVGAGGIGTLTFQWLKNGVPLVGATGDTLAIDGARTSASGAYAVAVTGVGGTTVSPVAQVTVEPRPLAGGYFGGFASGGSGPAFALFLRGDGTGVFLAHLNASQVVMAEGPLANVGREVKFQADVIRATGVLNRIGVEGVITPDGQFSGSMGGTPLVAERAGDLGAFSSVAGYYQGGVAGSSSSLRMIVAPAGEVFSLLTDGGRVDSFFGVVPPSAGFSGTTTNNGRLSASFRGSDAVFSGTFTPAGGNALTIGGRRPDAAGPVEALVNVSARSRVGGAAGALTAGFVVAGDAPKLTLVRAIGPTLATFGLNEALPSTQLQLVRNGIVLSSGLDWGAVPNSAAIAAAAARLGAFALPAASRDAALLVQVPPGACTAVVTGQANAEGIALVEVYDATDGPIPRGARITNLSTLSNAGAGENTLLVGFSITGLVPKRLLIRGAGPALGAFGVSGALSRPQLAVYSGNRVLMQNAGWDTSPDSVALAQAAANVGAFAFPANSADSALIIYLSPGTYSAQVSGVSGATGAVLVEIYDAP